MSISRLSILNVTITHRDISLFTLNASNASVCGVKSISPLGAAALLNKHTVVQTLLELSPGLVSVDLPDTKGRTPLMCTYDYHSLSSRMIPSYSWTDACQNGGLEVARHLLSHGARPDFRDAQFRTAIHYGLLHPRILWHCEDFLRRHRSEEITVSRPITTLLSFTSLIDFPATRQQKEHLPSSTSKRIVPYRLASHPAHPLLPRLSFCPYTHRNNRIWKIRRCTISIISPLIILPSSQSHIPRLPD